MKKIIILIALFVLLISGCTEENSIKSKIFACEEYKIQYIATALRCYDKEGNVLLDEGEEGLDKHARLRLDYNLSEMGFSDEEIDQLMKNYRKGCASKVTFEEMELAEPYNNDPDTIIKYFLKPDFNNICKNIDGKVYFWDYEGSNYEYYIERTQGASNHIGEWWTLEIDPHSLDLLNTEKYPFLKCSEFKYSPSKGTSYSWDIIINKENGKLKIKVSNVQPGGPAEEATEEELNELAENYKC